MEIKKLLSVTLCSLILLLLLSGCTKSKLLTDVMHKSPDNISEIFVINDEEFNSKTITDKSEIKKIFNEFTGIKVVKDKYQVQIRGFQRWYFSFKIILKSGKTEYLYIKTTDGKFLYIDNVQYFAVKSVLDVDNINRIFNECKEPIIHDSNNT